MTSPVTTLYTHLYSYHCSNCRMYGTVGRKAPADMPYKCPFCARYLAYKWSDPIVTDADRALAARGLTMNTHVLSQPPSTKRQCDTCRVYVELADMIRLGKYGRFCSQACADIEAEKIAAVAKRVLALKEERPWLK